MTMRNEGGFFAAHWDWLALAVALAALAGGGALYFMAGGEGPDEAAADQVARIARMRPKATGVKDVDLTAFRQADALAKTPPKPTEASNTEASYLSSARRVYCATVAGAETAACGRPIPPGSRTCPYCGAKQPEAPKVEPTQADTDEDGLSDAWEIANGLNPRDKSDADVDADRDGFSNREEYAAKTDPKSRSSHPDYLDEVKVLPLKETVLPFYLRTAMKTPRGMRLEFFDPKRRNDYGTLGTRYAVLEGEKIGDTGFVAGKYEAKSKRDKIGGSVNEKTVDISEATVVRASDGKKIVLRIDDRTRKPVDVQAKLVFERGGHKEFTVAPGAKFEFFGVKYTVKDIRSASKGVSVTLESDGKTRTVASAGGVEG